MKKNFADLSIAVFGDYCLDEYLWMDAALNEPSLETGLVAYQCTKRETYPGAAGTIAKNLSNLGIGKVYAVGYVGDDGRGFELRRGLDSYGINHDCLATAKDRATATYTKPWLTENGQTRELNRIDIKNWTPLPKAIEDQTLSSVEGLLGTLDALIIMDQITEEGCGLITDRVRDSLAKIARENPQLLVYADSRRDVSRFEDMIIKGNNHEIPPENCRALSKRSGRPVVCTMGERGVLIHHKDEAIEIPGVPISGQIDVTGAGDMFTAGFVSALAAGEEIKMAGRIGNIGAALCVQQLGTTGHVTEEDIRSRV